MAGEGAVQLTVKLGAKADAGTIKSLSAFPGVQDVIQTFPEERDPELSRLYVVKLKPSRAKVALQKLRKHPGIEYVEESAPRKLIW
jgi:hypothetical protein